MADRTQILVEPVEALADLCVPRQEEAGVHALVAVGGVEAHLLARPAGVVDSQAPESPQRDLFADLGTDHKGFVNVACASHYLVWETQHTILLGASQEWLREGTFDDQPTGSFFVDAQAHVQPK